MRIAFLTTLFMPSFGGAEIFLHHLAKDLTQRGHHAVVLAPRSRKHGQAFVMTYPHLRTLRARSKRFMVANALPFLVAAHWKHRFDLVHCQGEYHETAAAYAFHQLTGVPYVCRPIGGGFTNAENHPKVQQRLSRSLSKVSLMFAQGDFLRQRITSYGIDDQKIVTINNGVRSEEIRRGKAMAPVVNEPYLFFAGGLKPVKGYDLALRAFSRIASAYPDLKLVMMGINQKMDHFRQMVSELEIEGRVLYLHWCDRATVASLFSHASIYLCPFHRSPFSNANLEAMAAGIPIIATAVDGNIEQIEDGVQGFLIPPNDVDALAQKIDMILSDPDLRHQLGRNALSRSHFFGWQRMVDRYEQCYERVISHTGELK